MLSHGVISEPNPLPIGRIGREDIFGNCALCHLVDAPIKGFFVDGERYAIDCDGLHHAMYCADCWPKAVAQDRGRRRPTESTCPTCKRPQGQDKAECDGCAKRADRT